MTSKPPKGVPEKDAVHSLGGYIYQIYQAAIAWTHLDDESELFLEVAEDYAVVVKSALKAVQVKNSPGKKVTLNSQTVLSSIDDYITLISENPDKKVFFRYLTTATIGTEREKVTRIGKKPMIETWKALAKTGDLREFRKIFQRPNHLTKKSQTALKRMNDDEFRERVLKRISFDCGAPEQSTLERQLTKRVLNLLKERRGRRSQVERCVAALFLDLMKRSTKKESSERIVTKLELEHHLENATHRSVNEIHYELVVEAAATSATNAFTGRIPVPLSVSLPSIKANRKNDAGIILSTLAEFGICWISGAAGIGKRVLSHIVVEENGGNWLHINLGGIEPEHVSHALEYAAETATHEFTGLLIQDLGGTENTSVLENFIDLFQTLMRLDVMVICTSSSPPDSKLLFELDLPPAVERKVIEFTIDEIHDILIQKDIHDPEGAQFVHTISGGGHPLLAMAVIHNMNSKNWDLSELSSHNASLSNEALNSVYDKTRMRLRNELEKPSARLLERLSLKPSRRFTRDLALEIAEAAPEIPDAWEAFDDMVGIWLIELEHNWYCLSPLLTGLAQKTMTINKRKVFQYLIADSILRRPALDVREFSDLLLIAVTINNNDILKHLCLKIIDTNLTVLKEIAPFLALLLQIDTQSSPFDKIAQHLIRGTQLIIFNLRLPLQKLNEPLKSFEFASAENLTTTRNTTDFAIYFKLLIQIPPPEFTEFTKIVNKLHLILESETCPQRFRDLVGPQTFEPFFPEKKTLFSFMFFFQISNLSKIEDLDCAFEYLDTIESKLRSELLSSIRDGVDAGHGALKAWKNEAKNGTIIAKHRASFERQIELSEKWGETILEISCRMLQAHLQTQFHDDTNYALSIIDEGLVRYSNDPNLLRSKSALLFGSKDYAGCLQIASVLIPENDFHESERVRLGRDSGVSAEVLRDFSGAREYYLYSSRAAALSDLPEIKSAMCIGLQADAALAAWHSGQIETSLREFVEVVERLNEFSSNDQIMSIHNREAIFETLGWLVRNSEGVGTEHKPDFISPGCLSHPPLSKMILEGKEIPTELAWYQLAAIENYFGLDIGITDNLKLYINGNPFLQGELQFTRAKMYNALKSLNIPLFLNSLAEVISQTFHHCDQPPNSRILQQGTHPRITFEEQKGFLKITEIAAFIFCAMCIFNEKNEQISVLIVHMESHNDVTFSSEFVSRLQQADRHPTPKDNHDLCADLIFLINAKVPSSLSTQFQLAYNVLRWSISLGYENACIPSILNWANKEMNPTKMEYRDRPPRERLIHVLIDTLTNLESETESTYRPHLERILKSWTV